MNYITKVKVQNFFSVKEEVELDFTASEYSIDYNKNRLFCRNNHYTNKLVAFYGANASGKTTVLKSIVWFAYFVSNSNQKEFPDAHSNIYAEDNLPSYIELQFFHEDREFIYRLNLKYDKFSNIRSVKNEILKIKKDDNFEVLFNRKKEIFRNLELEDNNSLLFDELSPNSSLLNESRSRMKDYRSLSNFFLELFNHSNIFEKVNAYDMMPLTLSLLDKEGLEKLFELIQLEIDENIINTSLKFKNFLFEVLSLLGTDIKKSKVTIKKGKNKEIETSFGLAHTIDIDKYLPFGLESAGTRMLIEFIYKIFQTYENKSILIIDELDSLIHPMIVPILNLLTVKLNIQMFYSTHNISNMKYLYNDEIYLLEKDENHNTIVKTLKKDYNGYENFEKLYRNSLLGGVPNIENINFDFLDELEETNGK